MMIDDGRGEETMPYILGIDIGTSFTAAAIADLHPGQAAVRWSLARPQKAGEQWR
jgi:predicted NBD/HSP70 family sugar kinase